MTAPAWPSGDLALPCSILCSAQRPLPGPLFPKPVYHLSPAALPARGRRKGSVQSPRSQRAGIQAADAAGPSAGGGGGVFQGELLAPP